MTHSQCPITNPSELTDAVSRLNADHAEKIRHLSETVARLENEKRLLDLDCGEKTLQVKEEGAAMMDKVRETWRRQLERQLRQLHQRLSAPGAAPRGRDDVVLMKELQGDDSTTTTASTICDKLAKVDDLAFCLAFAVMQLQVGHTFNPL